MVDGRTKRLVAAVTSTSGGAPGQQPGNRPGVEITFATAQNEVRFPLGRARPKKPIRFAVGQPGCRSSVWRLWANSGKDDVYLASRNSATIFKISLHESGDWRQQWGPDGPGDVVHTPMAGPAPRGRILHQWSRPPADAAGWTPALSIWVPHEDVTEVPADPEPGEDARWLEPAAIGWATEIRLYLVQPDRGEFELTGALPGPDARLSLVDGFQLAGGEVVVVLAATSRLSRRLRRQVGRLISEQRVRLPADFDLAVERGPRALVVNVEDDGYRAFWDLSLTR